MPPSAGEIAAVREQLLEDLTRGGVDESVFREAVKGCAPISQANSFSFEDAQDVIAMASLFTGRPWLLGYQQAVVALGRELVLGEIWAMMAAAREDQFRAAVQRLGATTAIGLLGQADPAKATFAVRPDTDDI